MIKTHIMCKKPYLTGKTSGIEYALYSSLCGIKEPKSQAYGDLKPTCKRCLEIAKDKAKCNPQLT